MFDYENKRTENLQRIAALTEVINILKKMAEIHENTPTTSVQGQLKGEYRKVFDEVFPDDKRSEVTLYRLLQKLLDINWRGGLEDLWIKDDETLRKKAEYAIYAPFYQNASSLFNTALPFWADYYARRLTLTKREVSEVKAAEIFAAKVMAAISYIFPPMYIKYLKAIRDKTESKKVLDTKDADTRKNLLAQIEAFQKDLYRNIGQGVVGDLYGLKPVEPEKILQEASKAFEGLLMAIPDYYSHHCNDFKTMIAASTNIASLISAVGQIHSFYEVAPKTIREQLNNAYGAESFAALKNLRNHLIHGIDLLDTALHLYSSEKTIVDAMKQRLYAWLDSSSAQTKLTIDDLMPAAWKIPPKGVAYTDGEGLNVRFFVVQHALTQLDGLRQQPLAQILSPDSFKQEFHALPPEVQRYWLLYDGWLQVLGQNFRHFADYSREIFADQKKLSKLNLSFAATQSMETFFFDVIEYRNVRTHLSIIDYNRLTIFLEDAALWKTQERYFNRLYQELAATVSLSERSQPPFVQRKPSQQPLTMVERQIKLNAVELSHNGCEIM
jgi:hypothetical protein